MNVRALSLGFYGLKRRREGDVFILKPFKRKVVVKGKDGKPVIDPKTRMPKLEERLISAEEQFSKEWMEVVQTDEKATKPRSNRSFGKHNPSKEDMVMQTAKSVNEPEEEEEEVPVEVDPRNEDDATGDQQVI